MPADHHPLRDDLADAMCRHALITDWYEKADLVLADIEADVYRLELITRDDIVNR